MMSSTTTKKDVEQVVWAACDTFRGTIDPGQYKDYILVMLFWKYLSDLDRDEREKLEEKYKGDEERIKRQLKRGRFVMPEGCDFYSVYQLRNDDDVSIGEEIDKALSKIEEKNLQKLENVLTTISFNDPRNLGEGETLKKTLQHLLEDFADERLDLRPSHLDSQDVLGDAYEYLVANFASDSGKKGGEFYTPIEVAEVLARNLDVQPGEKVCDPCCGSGSLLIRASRRVQPDENGIRNVQAFGQELNSTTHALCRMNTFLHNFDNAKIERGDTIREPKLIDGDRLTTFDVIVANPPFSLDKWGHDGAKSDSHRRFHRGVPPKSRGDWAFISHMIETMDSVKGRVGVVVPHGVLFRAGGERTIRKAVIEENLLDGVIGLPANLFYGVGIPAALLFFRRGRKDGEGIFLIDASSEFEKGKQQNQLRPEDIEKIVTTWKAKKDIEKYAHMAELSEIEANDFNLNIPLYVDTFEEEEPVDLVAVKAEIERLDGELANAREELDQALKELGL